MSYILDALRRADSERGRGVVPGLHSQQGSARNDDKPAPSNNRLLVGVIVLLVVALLGVLVWNVLSSPPAPPPVVVAVPPPPIPARPPALGQPPVLELTELPPGAVDETPRPAVRKPVAGATEAAASAAPREARILALSELPEAVRRELPTLTVAGASYSENAASRMLILNGQVFHEGDRVAPGLKLAEIKHKAAVLEYKGYRYRIDY